MMETGGHILTAENGPGPEGDDKPGLHPVHVMQQRLRAAFGENRAIQDTLNDDCVAAINRFLKLTGWSQAPRRVFEAMPHADSIQSVAAFRSVLFKLGFKTTTEPAAPENLRREYLPCFIRQSGGRVLLAEKPDDEGGVVIFDPACGRSRTEPVDTIEGLAIFPEAIEQKERQSAAAPRAWSWQAIKAFAPIIRQIFLVSFAVNLFALAPPLFVMAVYDKAVGAKSFDVLAGLAIGVAFVVGADYILRKLRVRMQAYLGGRLDEQINETAFGRLLHLHLSHTEDAPIGSQLTRLRQMTSLREAFTSPLANAIFDLPFLLLFVAVIAAIGGSLVWVPVTLLAVYAVVAAWALPRSNQLVREAGNIRAQLNNLTVEAVSSQRDIRDLGAEHVWLRRHRRLSAQASVANMKARQQSFLIQTFSQSMVALAGAGTLALGAGRVIEGDLSAGALIAMMALSWRVLGPIRNLFLSGLTLGQTWQSIQQIDRLVRLPLEREPNKAPSIPRSFKGHVVFNNVTFRYPGAREPSLRGVSFSVQPGQMLCLYGTAGSGTSTVLHLLLGLHQQQAGSILIDGLDLRQLDMGDWRSALGVSLESPDLFYGTVAQNIRLARPDASDDDINAVVHKLGIDQYFGGALDRGLDTMCTVMARSTWPDPLVSRINLARAFIKDAPVYVLDAPAANLDFEGEQQALLSIMEQKQRGRAIIMTTQRPSHMRMADTVIWLESGAVREWGAPDAVVPKIMAA